MSKHTAGEWRIGDAGHTIFGPKVAEGLPRVIATVSKLDEEGRANVQVMRCAPEMLEALKYALETISIARQYFPKSIKNSATFRLENTCATIGTAIAKAEGSR